MANTRKPESGSRTQPVKKKTKKTAAPKASKAPVAGKEFLRRAAIAAMAVLAVFGIVLSAVSLRSETLQLKGTVYYAGMLENSCVRPIELSDEQVRQSVRNTKRRGDTHAFTYYCSRTLQLDADDLSGYILFGNPAGNDCDLVLSIFDAEENLIYRSGGLTPGNYITMIRLNVDTWESGEYACKAVVTAYKGHDLQYSCIGAQHSRLTVKVGETS